MSDDEQKAGYHDTLMRLFRGVEEHTVQFGILEETYADAIKLCRKNGWDEAEGLRIIFANGLSYLLREQELSRLNQGRADLVDEINRLNELYMEAHSMYAVMKYQAFVLGRDCKTLEMNVTGLRTDHEGMRQRLLRSRADEDRLRAEVATLRTELATLQANQSTDDKPTRFWERIRNWFK